MKEQTFCKGRVGGRQPREYEKYSKILTFSAFWSSFAQSVNRKFLVTMKAPHIQVDGQIGSQAGGQEPLATAGDPARLLLLAHNQTLPDVPPPHRLEIGQVSNVLEIMPIEEDGQLLVGRWSGYCTSEAIQESVRLGMEMITMSTKQPPRAVLSDGSAAMGDWLDLVPWMQYDLMPRLIQAGIQFIANVRSADPAGRLAHQDYARVAAQYLKIRLFDDAASARQWLQQMLRETPPLPRAVG